MYEPDRDAAFSEYLDLLEDALRARRLKRLPQTIGRRDRAAREAFDRFAAMIPEADAKPK